VAYTAYTCGRSLFNWSFYAGLGFGLNLPTLAYMWIFGFWLSVAKDKARVLFFIGLAMAYITVLAAGIQVAFRIKNDALAMVPGDLFNYVCQGANLFIVWWVFRRWVVIAPRKGYRSKWMSFLGDVSYPLYLLHMPVFAYLVGKSFTNAELLLLASVVFSAAVYLALDVYSRRRHLRSK
jgi:peptidoglycan/LPS O-acetylase OafA/YrhL